jgi:hypothetical protein
VTGHEYRGEPPRLSGEVVFGVAEPRIFTSSWQGRTLTPENSLGFAFIDWCIDVLKWTPLPWQQWLAIHALELHPEDPKRFRFRRLLVLVGRQSGKTTFAAALSLWKIVNDPSCELALGSAQVLGTARKCWQRAWDMGINAHVLIPDDNEPGTALLGPVNARQFHAAGRERWTYWRNGKDSTTGQTYEISATNRRARGDSASYLIMDELREQRTWDGWAALSKTTNAKRNGQLIAITNAGDDSSVVLSHLHGRGRAGAKQEGEYDGDLGLFEWSGEDGCDLDDPDELRQACPGVGYLTPIDVLVQQARDEPPEIVRTELLCQSALRSTDVVDADAWAEMADLQAPSLSERKGLILVFEATPDKAHATLTAATPADRNGRTRVEIAQIWTKTLGSLKMREELRTIIQKVRPKTVGYFPKGPGVAMLPDLAAACKRAGVSEPVAITEVPAACQALSVLVDGRRILHTGEPILEAQIRGAVPRKLGDQWIFSRGNEEEYVDALYSLAGAAYLSMLDMTGLHRTEA